MADVRERERRPKRSPVIRPLPRRLSRHVPRWSRIVDTFCTGRSGEVRKLREHEVRRRDPRKRDGRAVRGGVQARGRQAGELQMVRPADEEDIDDSPSFFLSIIFGGLYAIGSALAANEGRAGRHGPGVPGRDAVHADGGTDGGVRSQPPADPGRPGPPGTGAPRLRVVRGALRFPDGPASSSQARKAKEAREARLGAARHRVATVATSGHPTSGDDDRGAAIDPDAGGDE